MIAVIAAAKEKRDRSMPYRPSKNKTLIVNNNNESNGSSYKMSRNKLVRVGYKTSARVFAAKPYDRPKNLRSVQLEGVQFNTSKRKLVRVESAAVSAPTPYIKTKYGLVLSGIQKPRNWYYFFNLGRSPSASLFFSV